MIADMKAKLVELEQDKEMRSRKVEAQENSINQFAVAIATRLAKIEAKATLPRAV